MSGPTGIDALLAREAITGLNDAFCWHLDHDEVGPLAALFTEDAIYTHGARESRGREAIRALFEGRLLAGTRTARHVQSGLRIEFEGPAAARGASVCVTWAHDGPVPVPHAEVHLVADFIDRYERQPDGRWLIARRDIHRIFIAPGNAGPIGMTGTPTPAG